MVGLMTIRITSSRFTQILDQALCLSITGDPELEDYKTAEQDLLAPQGGTQSATG